MALSIRNNNSSATDISIGSFISALFESEQFIDLLGSIVSLLSTTAVGLAGRSANDNCVACRDLVAQIYVIHAPVPHPASNHIVRNQNGVLTVGQLPDDTVVTAFNIALNFHNLGLSRVEGAALGLFQNADIYQ